MKAIKKVKSSINNKKRQSIIKRYRSELINRNFSILSSNCNGGVITSDLGIRFNSPTINLYMEPKDFIKFVNNLKYYINSELVEIKNNDKNYPVGELCDIKIYFQHYSSFFEAKQKWDKRKKRINYENIFIMFTDRGLDNEDILKEFDKIDFKNKVVFTSKKYNNIKSSFYIKGFEKICEVGVLSEFIEITGKRYFDEFNFVEWLNNGEIINNNIE